MGARVSTRSTRARAAIRLLGEHDNVVASDVGLDGAAFPHALALPPAVGRETHALDMSAGLRAGVEVVAKVRSGEWAKEERVGR